MRGEGQRLTAHLKEVIAEIERLKIVYNFAIDQLETYTLANLSPQSAARWFKMYLRVVDLGIQIRRGEIRHRTTENFTYPCMHKTGTKGAVHSGLSIDDGNAIYQLMVDRKLVKESQLDRWFMKMDTMDRDGIGLLDKRVTRCLDNFRRSSSEFYDRLEVTGEDPYEEMLVLGATEASGYRAVAKVTRVCFGPTKCSCEENAKPWEEFSLSSDEPHALSFPSKNTEAVSVDEVGIIDIKRQMGFEQLLQEETHEDVLERTRDATELARHRKPREPRAPLSARNIYHKKCKESGTKPHSLIDAALVVQKGAHFLDLSGIGFHSADNLLDLVDIFSTFGLPPVKGLNVSNGFFNAAAFQALCRLLQIPVLRQTVERLSFRGIAVPQPADIAALIQLLTSDSSSIGSLPALDNLKSLDLSFNTLWGESAACLQPLSASLKGLKNLSLESCFPKPCSPCGLTLRSNDEKSAEECVYVMLTEASNQLECLNFGLNCVSTKSRWLDALFTPESTIQKLDLRGITSFLTCTTETMEANGQVGETWDLQLIQTLKWSSASSVHTHKFFKSLSAELQSGLAQLKHLDMGVTFDTRRDGEDQVDRKVADIIACIADYAVLKSCHIYYNKCGETISHTVCASVGSLLENGLHNCEAFTLRMPQLCLDPSAICDLLSCAVTFKMQKMTLAVGIASGGSAEPNFTLCFLQIRSIQDITLELHAAIESQSESVAIALARKLEASWLGLSSSDDSTQAGKHHVRIKVDRSFALTKHMKTNKRIYRCRFLAT